MKGAKRKPSAAKIANGSAAHNPSRVNHNEPQPPAGAPPKPKFESFIASKAWDDCVKWLADSQTLTVVEAGLIESYAINYADYERLRALWLETGNYSPGYRHAKDMNLKLLAEMGLTPSSRTRVSKIGDTVADPAEKFFKAM